MTSKAIVLNLFGGPCAGKTKIMAGVFAELKFREIDCEVAPEFAKEAYWRGNFKELDDQLYVFSEQAHRTFIIKDKVEVILTDSPLLFSLIYGKDMTDAFRALVKEQHKIYKTVNIFLNRSGAYNGNGRFQTEEEAIALDTQIKDMLDDNDVNFVEIESNRESLNIIADMVEDVLELYKED